MTRRRNTNARKPQQSTNGAHNTSCRTKKDTNYRDEPRKGSQDQDRVLLGGHGRRGHGDRRSMSPGRGDALGEQQVHHQDNRRSRTPLGARNTHDDPIKAQQVCGSANTHVVDQGPAKRKRESNDDDRQHAYKKARTSHGEIQPAAATKSPQDEGIPTVEKDKNAYKEVPGLATIKKLSEEARRKLREHKFGQTSVDPSKAAVSKAANQKSNCSEPTHGVKHDCKTTHVPETEPKAKALIAHTPGQKSKPSSARQSDVSTTVTIPESHDEAVTKATAITPLSRQQSADKITSKMKVPKMDESREALATGNSISPSSKASMPPTKRNKRKQEEVEDVKTIPAKKAKMSDAAIKRRNDKIKQSLNDHHLHADKNRFPEEGLTFVVYDAYSIPLLCSHSIEHQYPFEILNKLSDKLKRSFNNESEVEVFSRKMLVLRQEALRLSGKRFWTSEDLGRKKTSKSEPARVIGDCDLYLYNGRVHVATEQGLLLAASYLKLIGVPDTQPVRFDGHKPAWMGLITARPERRRVLKTWEPTPVLREGGCISIISGSIVVVYEHGVFDIDTTTGEESQMAYGARMDNGVAGWFMYANTCRMDWLEDPEKISKATLDPTMIDWAKFDFGPLAVRAAAQQAAQPTPTATAQETPTNNELSASHPPVSQASVFSTPRELVVASPADTAIPVATLATDTVIPAASKQDSELDTESTQSSVLQEKEKILLLSIAGGPISRHDSPNSRSDESASDKNDDIIGETSESQDSTTAVLPGQATDSGPAIVQEIPTGAFSKLRQALPGFDGPGRYQVVSREPGVPGTTAVRPNKSQSTVFIREEDVLDWDDSDL